ncbi:MAG: hypothetical protein Q7W51_04945 [Coriobacteriia bacterium]|nr:hypothetical protein [Coriobacteriia bacterium]
MVTPFEKLLAHEQQVALVSVLVARMSEAGILSEDAAGMQPSEIAALVMDSAAAEGSGSDAIRKALVFKVAEIVESVTNMVRGAAVKSAPAARKAGKVTADVAAAAGKFVFRTTSEAVRRMSPVYGPPCPRCSAPTVIRRNKKTHVPFAACDAWRDTGCNFTAGVTFTDD